MDRQTARLLAATSGWPVILVFAWLGYHFFGNVGVMVGTFTGIGVYFWGLFQAIPPVEFKSDKTQDPGQP